MTNRCGHQLERPFAVEAECTLPADHERHYDAERNKSWPRTPHVYELCMVDKEGDPYSVGLFSTREKAEAYGALKNVAEASGWDEWHVSECEIDDRVRSMTGCSLAVFGGHAQDWKPTEVSEARAAEMRRELLKQAGVDDT